MNDDLIGCGGAILTASIIIVPALAAFYFLFLEPMLATP